MQLDQACRIGAEAEPGAVAERYQPGVADTQIEPHGGDRQRHDIDAGVERQPERAQGERQRNQRQRREQ